MATKSEAPAKAAKKAPTTEEKVDAIIALIKRNGWSLPAILEDHADTEG